MIIAIRACRLSVIVYTHLLSPTFRVSFFETKKNCLFRLPIARQNREETFKSELIETTERKGEKERKIRGRPVPSVENARPSLNLSWKFFSPLLFLLLLIFDLLYTQQLTNTHPDTQGKKQKKTKQHITIRQRKGSERGQETKNEKKLTYIVKRPN